MKILVLNGPNLKLLGQREPGIYGTGTLADAEALAIAAGKQLGAQVDCYQSDIEGELVKKIGEARGIYDGIVINPAAYTHTSVALLDALKSVNIKTIEVHISDLSKREDFRQISYVAMAAIKTIKGHGLNGYLEAIDELTK
jgi:3-dehydroquinate dehydratase-2